MEARLKAPNSIENRQLARGNKEPLSKEQTEQGRRLSIGRGRWGWPCSEFTQKG